jgi:AraC family transcriptional regulator of adaptative response/methylated-DNA-[protein]-cysteine methyltransferase
MADVNYEEDFDRIATAIGYIRENRLEQPTLQDVATHVGLSADHLQRVFQRWAGISPKRFLQFLTVEHAKRLLDNSTPVLEAAIEAGLSGPGRLHDQFVSLDAVTPGEYKSGGEGKTIKTGFHATPFGMAFVGLTDRGLCGFAFGARGDESELHADLQRRWPKARLVPVSTETEQVVARIFSDDPARGLSLFVRGTNFRIQVWRALLEIPSGRLASYGDLADLAGCPQSVRAVASAVGANPVALLIPCHRVIRNSGLLGGYRWGLDRKVAIIARESATMGREP